MMGPLGLGTWALGGPYQFGWGPVGDDKSLALIRATSSCGVNIKWVDTAPAYGTGHAERVVGVAIRGMSEHTRDARLWVRISARNVSLLRP